MLGTLGELSIWEICYQIPQAVPPIVGQEKDQPLPLRPCFRPGFTEPVPLDTAGALLPHLCTLTPFSYQVSDFRYQLTFKTFPCCLVTVFRKRRYLSVALSSRSRALGVTQQVWSLGSPDFPQIPFNRNPQLPHQLSVFQCAT